jgi:predicted MFS family arabinose efflux permease
MPSASLPLNAAQEKRLLYTLAGIQFTNLLDFMIIMPLAPALTRDFGLSTTQFGWLVSSYTFGAALSALCAAVLVDRFNRRTVIVALYGGFALATLACAVAPNYVLLLIARSLAGVFGGVLGAMVHTVIGDVVPYERRGRATGVVMGAFGLATVAGVPLGLVFANHSGPLGWRAPFLFVAFMAAIIFTLGLRSLPSIAARTQDLRLRAAFEPLAAVLREPNHWRAFAFVLLLMFSGFTVIPYITLYLTANVGFPETLLPLMYLAGGACTLFTSRWFGRLADQHGKARVFQVLAAVSIVPILILTHSPAVAWGWVLVYSAFFFIFVSGRFVPGMAIVTSAATPQLRGTFMSLYSAVQSAGSGLAALVAGMIITRDAQGRIEHYPTVGYVACAAALLAMWMAYRVRPADAGIAVATAKT